MKKNSTLIFFCIIISNASCYGMFAKYREQYRKYYNQREGLDQRYGGLPSTLKTGEDAVWRNQQEAAIQKRVNEGSPASREELLEEIEGDLRGPRKGYLSGMSIYTNLGGYYGPKYDRVTVPTERGNVTFTVPHDKYPETKKPYSIPTHEQSPRNFKNLWGLLNRTRPIQVNSATQSSNVKTMQPRQQTSNWFTRWWYGK